jgi:hypothetical protein
MKKIRSYPLISTNYEEAAVAPGRLESKDDPQGESLPGRQVKLTDYLIQSFTQNLILKRWKKQLNTPAQGIA